MHKLGTLRKIHLKKYTLEKQTTPHLCSRRKYFFYYIGDSPHLAVRMKIKHFASLRLWLSFVWEVSICGYRPLTETIQGTAASFNASPAQPLPRTGKHFQLGSSKALLCQSSFESENNGEWKRKEDGEDWHTKDQRSWLARKKRYFLEVCCRFDPRISHQMPFPVSRFPTWSWASLSGRPTSASCRSENGFGVSPLNVPPAGWTKKSWSAELQKAMKFTQLTSTTFS